MSFQFTFVECKPAQMEIQELYRKKLEPGTDDSQTEIDIENVDTSKSSENKDVSIVVCPRDPLGEKPKEGRMMNKCHCMNENFVTLRRDGE